MSPAPQAGATGSQALEWCCIACVRSGRQAAFHVLVVEKGGSRRSVVRSPSFRLGRSGRIRARGESRAAYDALVSRLVASGWRRVDSSGAWHDSGFVRPQPDPQRPPVDRLMISCRRDGRSARFFADELDEYGNPTQSAESPPFVPSRWPAVKVTDEAKAAHSALLHGLQSDGWSVIDAASDAWFAQVMVRRRG
jgi:hypothetical protein